MRQYHGPVHSEVVAEIRIRCAYRWGLVIEMIIEVFAICVRSGATTISIDHFVSAFSEIYGLSSGFSPFLMPDYQDSFDSDKLMDLLDRDR